MADLPKTILYPEAFKRSPTAGFDGVYHWEWWEHAINLRGIQPMDCDGLVELNNFFLMAETKDPGNGPRGSVPIPTGQQLSIDALVRTGLFTVIYQIGKETPVSWSHESFKRPRSEEIMGGLNPDRRSGSLFEFVQKWRETVCNASGLAWRKRAILAALDGAPPVLLRWLVQWLLTNMKQEHVKAIGLLANTPLGEASAQAIDCELDKLR